MSDENLSNNFTSAFRVLIIFGSLSIFGALSAIFLTGCSGHPDPASGEEFYIRKVVRAGDDAERAQVQGARANDEIRANLSEGKRSIDQSGQLVSQTELTRIEIETRAKKLGVKLTPTFKAGKEK